MTNNRLEDAFITRQIGSIAAIEDIKYREPYINYLGSKNIALTSEQFRPELSGIYPGMAYLALNDIDQATLDAMLEVLPDAYVDNNPYEGFETGIYFHGDEMASFIETNYPEITPTQLYQSIVADIAAIDEIVGRESLQSVMAKGYANYLAFAAENAELFDLDSESGFLDNRKVQSSLDRAIRRAASEVDMRDEFAPIQWNLIGVGSYYELGTEREPRSAQGSVGFVPMTLRSANPLWQIGRTIDYIEQEGDGLPGNPSTYITNSADLGSGVPNSDLLAQTETVRDALTLLTDPTSDLFAAASVSPYEEHGISLASKMVDDLENAGRIVGRDNPLLDSVDLLAMPTSTFMDLSNIVNDESKTSDQKAEELVVIVVAESYRQGALDAELDEREINDALPMDASVGQER